MRRLQWYAALVVALACVAGCATGQAVRNADRAADRGDWDTAVVFYRQALGKAPARVDLKLKLEKATRSASADHIKRARQLESQDQLPGAMAEYKLAADLDASNTYAVSKAYELERKIRDQAEAARPRARMDTLRQQASEQSPIPRLDPRTPLPRQQFTNTAVRDILRTIGVLTGINILYDQGLDAALSRPYSMDIQQTPVEEVLLQVLQANQLMYKIQTPRTIFIYQDTPAKRLQYEDQYVQNFYLSNADPADIQTSLTALLNGTQLAIRPVFTVNKAMNALTVRATAPVLGVIANYVASMDRPVPQVSIEGEVLEVDRNFVRTLGLDLNQWALGLQMSPEVSPSNSGAGAIPPANPGPYNLNTLSRGVSAADFYLTSPAMVINLLESNTNTKVLARPQATGQAGKQIQLKLGDQVPIPQTVFQSASAGGLANLPTTSVNYQAVGVNLIFTPKVTYQDEIVLDGLHLEKSGLGNNLDVGGQTFPTIVSRVADVSIQLRDGESTLIAGLLRDEDTNTAKSLPGLANVPILRSIFGNSNRSVDQTDIVMIITPHIVRGHDLKAEDLKPMYVGTGTNVGASAAPPLISPDALAAVTPPPPSAPAPSSPAGGPRPVAPASVPAPLSGPQVSDELPPLMPPPQGGVAPSSPARAPGVVAVPSPAAPAGPAGGARVILTAPAAGPGGALQAGSGPFTMPIQIADAADVTTVALTIMYDPAVIAAPTLTQGSFMMQGGAMVTFVPSTSTPGRIDLAVSRPSAKTGASGSGLLAAISFTAGSAGTTDFTVTGVATTAAGQAIPLRFTPARVTVR